MDGGQSRFLDVCEGASPDAPNFDIGLANQRPLSAFLLLAGGDVFETLHGKPPPDGAARARQYVASKLTFELHGAPAALGDNVRSDVAQLIGGSLELLGRLEVARPIQVTLVPRGKALSQYGFPRSAPPHAVGLFWDDRNWEVARIALRQERLGEIPQLAVHEMAHAIHFLAFSEQERELIYRLLLRTFRTRAAVDEVFAIYTGREFVGAFTAEDKRAPGVYGLARQRWSEDHVFTRFVRNLYAPYKPLAGGRVS